MGFDSFIVTTLNFGANVIFEMQRHVENGEIEKARINQRRITDLAYFVIKNSKIFSDFLDILFHVSIRIIFSIDFTCLVLEATTARVCT